MFKKGEIWAYPTDTSFGLGVRADDEKGLARLMELKRRSGEKYFSLMVRDWEMLKKFAVVDAVGIDPQFFSETPRTAILEPTKELPISKFWPLDKVAFRVCTLPEIAIDIDYPITATSANLSGRDPIYSVKEIEIFFEKKVKINQKSMELEINPPSEIWDFTDKNPIQIR